MQGNSTFFVHCPVYLYIFDYFYLLGIILFHLSRLTDGQVICPIWDKGPVPLSRFTDHKAGIDHNKCVGCGRCIGSCNFDAVHPTEDNSKDILNCRIAEYTYAVVKDRPHFHISLVVDVSPNCDCHSENDIPIVPDVGIFASFDPVALDVACADAVNRQTVIQGSVLSENSHVHNDHFTNTHPETNWKSCIEHAVKIGLGSSEYELIEIK